MKVAVVQEAPPLLDRAGALAQAAERIREEAVAGASLVVFPEAYVGGYPAWIWRLRPEDDARVLSELHRRFAAQGSLVARGDLAPLSEAARDAGVTVVIGFNEIDRPAAGSVFNSVATIGSDGAILNVHRKLMPTGPERTVWAAGDARGLRVVETPAGRIGTLICWEAYMPLSRFALYAQGLDVLVVPTWDHDDSWLASMRHIAKEGACWVVSTATSVFRPDLPETLPAVDEWRGDRAWLCRGEAVVVRPFGKVAAGPLEPERPVLHAEIDHSSTVKARRLLDVAGHYSRPDVFHLSVDRSVREQVDFGPRRSDVA